MITLGDFQVAVAKAAAQDGRGEVVVLIDDWELKFKSVTAVDGNLELVLEDDGILIEVSDFE